MLNTVPNHNFSKQPKFPHLEDCLSSAEINSKYGGRFQILLDISPIYENSKELQPESFFPQIYIYACKCIFMNIDIHMYVLSA